MSEPFLCNRDPLWPKWFIFDTAQAIIFTFCNCCVTLRFQLHGDVVSKLTYYNIILILRPLAIYLFHAFTQGKDDQYNIEDLFIINPLLQFMNLINVLMFFYLIFKMKVIQIILQASVEHQYENNEYVIEMIKSVVDQKIRAYKKFLCLCICLLFLMTIS